MLFLYSPTSYNRKLLALNREHHLISKDVFASRIKFRNSSPY
ncbi:hypothetical protein PORCRE_1011 [Porphyromonas crevioricanis JCM 15906]|uniref:Uncharacterized protein n=1 Tax=Porphyromonas crevioricanis JCM 15906 TaxID=1305617 RepID=T1CHF0_9PORP|nr:hypothetical protein PORCRE_1011 [Porphyromonas crevioricanis JCM 15906]GAD06612.1 hypothetical protein PORCAN_210 [Porphyromonas crevioricanis JCM 13913]